MNTSKTTSRTEPEADENAPKTRASQPQASSAQRLPYAPPTITSSGIFHTVSNGPTPQLGCGTYG